MEFTDERINDAFDFAVQQNKDWNVKADWNYKTTDEFDFAVQQNKDWNLPKCFLLDNRQPCLILLSNKTRIETFNE